MGNRWIAAFDLCIRRLLSSRRPINLQQVPSRGRLLFAVFSTVDPNTRAAIR